jgi:ABC-2 type transport system ATP-binding protein
MIEAKKLKKSFGDRVAVDELELSVQPGEIYALLGGNGAGKTITMHLLLGLIPADSGEAIIDGARIVPGVRPRAAFVPEVVDLYADLDPIETLELFLGIAGIAKTAEEIAVALEHAGLDRTHHRRRLRVFSKGMRQKVALAIAEAQGAKAIFLDEPTSGLDPAAAESLMSRLIALKNAGAAILMTTHDVLQVQNAADRVGFVREGKLLEERRMSDLGGESLLQIYRRVIG